MDLAEISKATQLADAIAVPLSQPIRHAIASTVFSLAQIQGAFDNNHSLFIFSPDHLLILPRTHSPSDTISSYYADLTLLANNAAESLSCSSILAGQGNESDDTGDVALWLGEGDYGPGKEENVLKLLSLTPWIERGAQVSVPTYKSRLMLRLTSEPV